MLCAEQEPTQPRLMPCSPDLLSLPPELFELVPYSITGRDMMNLRLVCSEAASKTQRTFVNFFFADQALLLCGEASLRGALPLPSMRFSVEI